MEYARHTHPSGTIRPPYARPACLLDQWRWKNVPVARSTLKPRRERTFLEAGVAGRGGAYGLCIFNIVGIVRSENHPLQIRSPPFIHLGSPYLKPRRASFYSALRARCNLLRVLHSTVSCRSQFQLDLRAHNFVRTCVFPVSRLAQCYVSCCCCCCC